MKLMNLVLSMSLLAGAVIADIEVRKGRRPTEGETHLICDKLRRAPQCSSTRAH